MRDTSFHPPLQAIALPMGSVARIRSMTRQLKFEPYDAPAGQGTARRRQRRRSPSAGRAPAKVSGQVPQERAMGSVHRVLLDCTAGFRGV